MTDLNTIQLDPALQIGSDPTASHVSNPKLLLFGNGIGSMFDVQIDGRSIGVFTCDTYNKAFPQCPPLADGHHRATGFQTNPAAGHDPAILTPFDFTIDTVPPAVPSQPSLVPFYWEGGDPNRTTYRTFGIQGTATPSTNVRLFTGTRAIGGSGSDANGHWGISVTLEDGTFPIVARTLDTAGNFSDDSTVYTLTVEAAPPPPPPPGRPDPPRLLFDTSTRYLSWAPPLTTPADAITEYRVYRSINSGVSWQLIYTGGPDARNYVDAPAPLGSSYRITAVNADGESDPSR